MADKSWKSWERRLAKWFGTERRGADYADERGGKDDFNDGTWSVEVKLLGKPTYGLIVKACEQAERNCRGLIPLAIVKKNGALDKDALVSMRLETFSKLVGLKTPWGEG